MTLAWRRSWWRVWQGAAAVLVVVACAVAIMPISPDYPAAALDSAWMFALNAAVARHLAFGRDIVFTFGPYVSVYTRSFFPGTDSLAMGAGALLALAVAAGLLILTRERGRWLAALTAVLLSRLAPRDPLFFATGLLFVAVVAASCARTARTTRLPVGAAVLLVAALALLPAIKGTFSAVVAVSLGLAGLLLMLRGRAALLLGLSAVFAASLLGYWLLAGQPLACLPIFFASQGEIVRGYTEAMALDGPLWQLEVFGLLGFGVLAFNLASVRDGGLPAIAVLAGAAALLLLAFKAGFIRQDGHIGIAAGVLGLTGCLLGLANRGRGPLLGAAAGLLGWAILGHAADGLGPRGALGRVAAVYHDAGRDLMVRLAGGQALLARYENALAAIRHADPLPRLSGPTDIYSTGQAILLAHGLDWSPRPVLQSYSAYTAALEERDARHLSGAAAPTNVIIKVEPVDDRLPSLEDGTSWPVLLGRYEAAALVRDMAIFRLSSGQASTVGAPSRSAHRLGEIISIPAGSHEPVWAKVDVEPSALGRVAASLFRPPPVHITVHLVGGRTRSFVFVPAMGRAGFLLAPLVGSAVQLVALQVGGADVFQDADVGSFSIDADERFWRRTVTVELAPLHVTPRSGAISVLFAEPRPVAVDGSTAARCNADMLDGRLVDASGTVEAAGGIRLTGWGFVTDDGREVEPDTMTLAVQAADGSAVGVPATMEPRPDVGLYFHRPGLSQVGFQALLDLAALSGPHRFMLLMSKGSHHWSCPLIARADIVADGSAAAACRGAAAPAGRCG